MIEFSHKYYLKNLARGRNLFETIENTTSNSIHIYCIYTILYKYKLGRNKNKMKLQLMKGLSVHGVSAGHGNQRPDTALKGLVYLDDGGIMGELLEYPERDR